MMNQANNKNKIQAPYMSLYEDYLDKEQKEQIETRDNQAKGIYHIPLYLAHREKRSEKWREEQAFKKQCKEENRIDDYYNYILPTRKFKFTAKEKREWMNKCNKYFPNMNMVDHRRMGQFIGPLYVAIIFGDDNSGYAGLKPHLYSKSLVSWNIQDQWSIGFSSSCPTVEHHWPDDVLEEVMTQLLKKRFPLKTEGPVKLEDIFLAYYISERVEKEGGLHINHVRFPGLIAAWAGDEKIAEEYFQWILSSRQLSHDKINAIRDKLVEEGIMPDHTINYLLRPLPDNDTMNALRDELVAKGVTDEKEIDEVVDKLYVDNPDFRDKDYSKVFLKTGVFIKYPEILRQNFFESVKALSTKTLKLYKASYQDIEGVPYKAKDEFERLFR